jgi:hypothetical protein
MESKFNVTVNSFDVYGAEDELKKCPTIIKTYVKLLKEHNEHKQRFINELIQKIKNERRETDLGGKPSNSERVEGE